MKRLAKQLLIRLLWGYVHRQIKLQQPYVIAVTGSVGKTSVKEAVALVLAEGSRPVIKTVGNLNSEIGLPLSLLGFEESPTGLLGWFRVILASWARPPKMTSRPYYVLEYSSDKPGDIAYLASRIPADVAILTQISPVHMQAFGRLEALIQEKLSLLTYLRPEGYVVINGDDPYQQGALKMRGRHYFFSLSSGHEPKGEGVWLKKVESGKKGLECTLQFSSGKPMDGLGRGQTPELSLQTKVIGVHQLLPLLVAAEVGVREGIALPAIKRALEKYTLPNGRGRIIEGYKGIIIIDDSYNASPVAVMAGLDMLRPFAAERRIVAVLGTMNELGEETEAAHREVARYTVGKVDYLVVAGPYAELMQTEAIAAGFPATQVISFRTPEQLLHQVDQVVRSRDVVYVKGSQNKVRLERFVKKLMAHPEQAATMLVRQGKYWQ